jgi:hypothetical protein
MRPVLAAVQQQETAIKGIRATAEKREAMHRTAFNQLREQNRLLTEQNQMLGRGLRTLAKLAGVEQQVVQAMFRTADVQNPAQPIPEPPAQPAPYTTVDAETPEAMADVQTPGLVGGSTNDVAADATSTVYTPGADVEGSPLKNLVDVTAPVEGTQGPQPLSDVRTETDVRVGNPMNPQVGFPLRGEFQQGQRLQTGAAKQGDGNRTMASLRLARLRIATGTAQGGDIELATEIEKDASLSDGAIENEIRTLEGVRTAAAKRAPQRSPESRGLVPRAAARTVPSMQGAPIQHTAGMVHTSTDAEVADADLFD